MRTRDMRRKLTAITCVIGAGVLGLVSAPPAGADPVGTNAVAEFGIKYEDEGLHGQCAGAPVEQWKPEGEWTTAIAVDTDNRPLGCMMWFALNNVDGSLNGLDLHYEWAPSPGNPNWGQCHTQFPVDVQIPYFPFPFSFRSFSASPIHIDTTSAAGYCDLKFMIFGRGDIALDIRWDYNGDRGQCVRHTGSVLPDGSPNPDDPGQIWTVKLDEPKSIGFDTDERGGACWLKFRLRHL
jgi:hypothetical protein